MNLSVIIVLYGGHRRALRLIRGLRRVLGVRVEIIVVDNGARSLGVKAFYSDIVSEIIVSETNIGYAGAANAGAESASGDLLFFLNPDTYLPDSSILQVFDYATRLDNGGAFSPLLVFENGNEAPCCGYFHFRLRRLLGRFLPCLAKPRMRRELVPVDWVAGTAMVIRRSRFKEVDGFCPLYYMYFEDVDLCFRLARRGLVNYVVPGARIVHSGGASFKTQAPGMKEEYYRKSRDLFLSRHGGFGARILAPFLT